MAVAAIQILHPEPFDFSNPSDWARWVRRFQRFRVASGLKDKPDEYQVNSLLYTLGDAADDILGVLPLTDENKKKYDAVKTAFEQHCVGKHNVVFERAKFNMRCQQELERAEAFITSVHTLADRCSFGVLKEELI